MKNKKQNKKLKNLGFVALATFLLVVGLVIADAASSSLIEPVNKPINSDRKVTVVGSSQTTVSPDEATVYLGVTTKGKTAKKAKQANADLMEEVRYALYDIGVDKEDIETVYFYVNPVYDWGYRTMAEPTSIGSVDVEIAVDSTEVNYADEDETSYAKSEFAPDYKRRITRYEAVHQIKVKVHDLDDVGEIIDAAVNAGANRVNNVRFELSDERREEVNKELLVQAAKEAKGKAKVLANALNAKLGKVIEIVENNYFYPYYESGKSYAMSEGVANTPTQIDPKSMTVSASVRVSFALK